MDKKEKWGKMGRSPWRGLSDSSTPMREEIAAGRRRYLANPPRVRRRGEPLRRHCGAGQGGGRRRKKFAWAAGGRGCHGGVAQTAGCGGRPQGSGHQCRGGGGVSCGPEERTCRADGEDMEAREMLLWKKTIDEAVNGRK